MSNEIQSFGYSYMVAERIQSLTQEIEKKDMAPTFVRVDLAEVACLQYIQGEYPNTILLLLS